MAIETSPPYRCIYCDDASVERFSRAEHIVPESLGNERNDILPPGWVCDDCNQYFGAKVEELVLRNLPFALERVGAAIPTKKRRHPKIQLPSGVRIRASGAMDRVIVDNIESLPIDPFTGERRLETPPSPEFDRALARMLVKIGIGCLAHKPAGISPYDSQLALAKRFAREAPRGLMWEFAYGEHPNRLGLVQRIERDRLGMQSTTHRLYSWTIREESSGHVHVEFMYRTHVYVSYLTRPDLGDFVERNAAKVPFRWSRHAGGSPAS